MVEYQSAPLDRVFGALADPTRRAILSRLTRRPATISEIAEPFAMTLAAVSKHVRVLERAGLVRREVEGRVHRCSFRAAPLADAAHWMEHYRRFWEDRLDSLERFLVSNRKRRNRSPGRRDGQDDE
jgi:DNA-binding transcriptional ArsR family regulator